MLKNIMSACIYCFCMKNEKHDGCFCLIATWYGEVQLKLLGTLQQMLAQNFEETGKKGCIFSLFFSLYFSFVLLLLFTS